MLARFRYALLGSLAALGLLSRPGNSTPSAPRSTVALNAAEPDQAAKAAQPPAAAVPELAPHLQLLEQIVPASAKSPLPVRPPFQPARYDMGLASLMTSEKKAEDPEDSKVTLDHLREAAAARQTKMLAEWRELCNTQPEETTPDEGAAWQLLRYALGSEDPAPALAAARRAGPAARLRWSRLLLAECRFEEAVSELAMVAGTVDPADKSREIHNQALAILMAHHAERTLLAKTSSLIPLKFDLAAFLEARAQDATDGPLVRRLRKAASRIGEKDDPIGHGGPEQFQNADVYELELLLQHGAGEEHRLDGPHLVTLPPRQIHKARLVSNSNEMVLYRRDSRPIAGPEATFELHSIFHGPIQFRLYRFPSPDDIASLTGADLAGLTAEREWVAYHGGIHDNNVSPLDKEELAVKLKDLTAGHYFMTAQARYSPLLATCQFSVSSVALYLHVGRNQGAVVAVDRHTAAPRANLPLRLTIHGTPQLWGIRKAERIDDQSAAAFDQGFYNSPRQVQPADQALPDPAQAEKARARGAECRLKYADFKQQREIVTDEQGHVAFNLDLGRTTHSYRVDVEHLPPTIGPLHEDGTPVNDDVGLARVRVSYYESAPEIKTRALLWMAQPVYRPGDTLDFKGIVRQFDGETLADGAGGLKQVTVTVQSPRQEIVWTGVCPVSEFGTIAGSFTIEKSACMGPYTMAVNGASAGSSYEFLVSAFRVPTYRVRIVRDPGQPEIGGQITGEVVVEHYTGRPAVGAEVEVICHRHIRALATDLRGRARFAFPVDEQSDERRYTIHATVFDLSLQSHHAMQHVTVKADPFYALLAQMEGPPREAAWSESEFARDFRVTVRTWAGHPIAGASISVPGNRRASTTGPTGEAVIAVPVTQDGRYDRFVVSVVSQGGAVTVAQQGIPPLQEYKTSAEFKVVDLSLPHAVDAGQQVEVRFRLLGPIGQKATVVLLAENARLLTSRALHLEPGEHIATIATQPDWAPSMVVRAISFDGSRKETAEGHCYLRPLEKFLTLSVASDKSEYRPGQICTAVVTAVDHQNRPAPNVEISLGVVDAALYDISRDPTPDLQQFFHEYHQKVLCKSDYDTQEGWWQSRTFVFGPRYAWGYYSYFDVRSGAARRAMLSSAGGMGGSGNSPASAWRSDFRTTAHWVTNLVTDARGQARSTFAFPAGVTSWRFTARGVTADTRVGEVRTARKTLLPLSIDLALPRAIRDGDQIQIPVLLQNELAVERRVAGTTQIGNNQAVPWPARPLVSRGVGRFDLPFTAGKLPVKLAVRVQDDARRDEDAVLREVAPLPRTQLETRQFAGLLDKEVQLRADLGGRASPDGFALELCREPGYSGPVESALAELIDYPYGCVEQTMSRFMPALVADHAMQKAGLANPTSKKLPEIFAQGLARLSELQNRKGGWGWWQHDNADGFMTAYVILGLAMCREAGAEVPQQMLARGRYQLMASIREKPSECHPPGSIGDVELAAYSIYAMARLVATEPESQRQDLEELKSRLEDIDTDEERDKKSLLTSTLMAHSWLLLGERARAAERIDVLAGKVDLSKLSRPRIQEAAALLELGQAVRPHDPRWPRIADQLVNLRRETGWGDTLTTSAAVRGLSTLIKSPEKNDAPVAVLVEGHEAGQLTRESPKLLLPLAGGENVTLRPDPGCPDRFTGRLTGRLTERDEQPTEPPADADAVMRIHVSTQVPPLTNDAGEELPSPAIPADARGRLSVPLGTTVELRCDVELRKGLSHARLTIPRPCGVELVRSSRIEGQAGAEERDDAFHLFIEHWPAGRHEIRLLLRAEVAGTVSAPWPQLEPMYADPLNTWIEAPREWRVEANAAKK